MTLKLDAYSNGTYFGTTRPSSIQEGMNFYTDHGWSVREMRRGRLYGTSYFTAIVERNDLPGQRRTLRFRLAPIALI